MSRTTKSLASLVKNNSFLNWFTAGLLTLVLMSWVFITPPGSGIDDDFHLPSIWCGQGDKTGQCELGKPNDLLGKVPDYVAIAPYCIGYQPFNSGQCTIPDLNDEPKLLGARINELGLYMPNGFYFINSLLIVNDFYTSIWLMRGLSVAIFLLLYIVSFKVGASRDKNLLNWLIIVSFNPLFFSVIASNNNSAWFFASVIFLWYFIFTFFKTKILKEKIITLLCIIFIFTLAINSRTDHVAFLIIFTIMALYLKLPKKYAFAYTGLVAAVALPFLILGRIPGVGSFGTLVGFGSINPERSWNEVLIYNTLNSYKLFNGLLGGWGINWLDFFIPQYIFLILQISILITLAIAFVRFNKMFVIGILGLVGMLLIYLWILQIDLNLIGEMVQPRYLYPLFIFSLGFIVFSSDKLLSLSNNYKFLLALSFTMPNSLAMFYTLRRYVTGIDIKSWNLDAYIEWWPIFGTPMIYWILSSIILFLTSFLLMKPNYPSILNRI